MPNKLGLCCLCYGLHNNKLQFCRKIPEIPVTYLPSLKVKPDVPKISLARFHTFYKFGAQKNLQLVPGLVLPT